MRWIRHHAPALFLLLSLLGLPVLGAASPSKAKWRREIPLAANDSVFATLVFAWDWPGSYYVSSDTVLVNIRSNATGIVLSQNYLWSNVRRTDVNTNERSIVRTRGNTLDLNEFFEKNDLTPLMAGEEPYGRWDLDSTGICVVAKPSIRETVVPLKELISNYPELSNFPLPRILGVYTWPNEYYYAVLSVGTTNMEDTCYEKIILIDNQRVREANRRLTDRLWPNRRH